MFILFQKTPDINNYIVKNDRKLCSRYNNKDKCSSNLNCRFVHDKCFIVMTDKILLTFVNKVSNELVNDNIKKMELLQIDNYFVSDIVDYSKFTRKNYERIIRSNSSKVNDILESIFGKMNIPVIGKKKGIKFKVDYEKLSLDYPLKDVGKYYVQEIYQDNDTIFRGYVNGFYWNKYIKSDIDIKNLGYYNKIQTTLIRYFKSAVIDWVYKNENMSKLINVVKKLNININVEAYLKKFIFSDKLNSPGIIELFILNDLYSDYSIFIYNENKT